MRLLSTCAGVCFFFVSATAWSANVTWVSFHDTDGPSADAAAAGLTAAADIGYTDLLSANGHTVSRFLTHEPLTTDDLSQLNASDLVIISRSVNSGQYDPPTDWNTQVTAPVCGHVRLHPSQQPTESYGRYYHGGHHRTINFTGRRSIAPDIRRNLARW